MRSQSQTTLLTKPNGGQCPYTFTVDPATAPWLSYSKPSDTQIMVNVQSTDLSLSGSTYLISVTVTPVYQYSGLPNDEVYSFEVQFVNECQVNALTLGVLPDREYIIFDGT